MQKWKKQTHDLADGLCVVMAICVYCKFSENHYFKVKQMQHLPQFYLRIRDLTLHGRFVLQLSFQFLLKQNKKKEKERKGYSSCLIPPPL